MIVNALHADHDHPRFICGWPGVGDAASGEYIDKSASRLESGGRQQVFSATG